MRKGMWSAAAFVIVLSVFGAPRLQAADTVTMGSEADPYAFKFFPAEITVQVGSTVTWENQGGLPHDAKADNGSFASPLLNTGETFKFTFNTPGDVTYYCSVEGHRDAGMTGVVKVVGGSTPTTAATTPSTQAPPAGGGATTTTAAGPGQPTTTTTAARNAGGSTTTTTASEATPGETPTSAPAVTPTSAPDVAGDTTTTTAGHGTEEAAAGGDHASSSGSEQNKKTNPLAIAFAGLSTVVLIGITGKLLASPS